MRTNHPPLPAVSRATLGIQWINKADPSPEVRTRANTGPRGPGGRWWPSQRRRGGGPGACPLGEAAQGCPRPRARSRPQWRGGLTVASWHPGMPRPQLATRPPHPPLPQRACLQGLNQASVQVLEAKQGAARPPGPEALARAVAGVDS